MKRNRTGKTILLSVAGLTAAGGFLADWNKTHIFNPKWTPHAKFHDAMTIMLGTMLGASGLYLLQKKTGDRPGQLRWGTMLPAFFWVAQGSSFVFPGAKGLEAEFPERVPKLGGVWLNEAPFSALMLAVLSVGYVLEKKTMQQESQ
ncbi:hypothetical protein LJY25_19185 [Hymenobacter sp. BT175]|uniref:DUF6640 family protein n=1 Tax=Hymenobacter translucens TaxID=2886507 RepID=UPI001D0E0D5C|nr:DUF6640 family protein [Hymenobacter translucens]MCC2548580.1 hypothetical protein [Hymenobacter translucens]